jgi:hypothetical protein
MPEVPVDPSRIGHWTEGQAPRRITSRLQAGHDTEGETRLVELGRYLFEGRCQAWRKDCRAPQRLDPESQVERTKERSDSPFTIKSCARL